MTFAGPRVVRDLYARPWAHAHPTNTEGGAGHAHPHGRRRQTGRQLIMHKIHAVVIFLWTSSPFCPAPMTWRTPVTTRFAVQASK